MNIYLEPKWVRRFDSYNGVRSITGRNPEVTCFPGTLYCSLDLISVLDFDVWLNLEACGFQPRKPLNQKTMISYPYKMHGTRLYIYLHCMVDFFMVNVLWWDELRSSTGFLRPESWTISRMLVSGSAYLSLSLNQILPRVWDGGLWVAAGLFALERWRSSRSLFGGAFGRLRQCFTAKYVFL